MAYEIGDEENKRVEKLLTRLILSAKPISADNPAVEPVDSVNTQAKTGVYKEMSREAFTDPNSVAIEIRGRDIDAIKPPGDGTIQMFKAIKTLGVPNDKWQMAFMVKDSRKVGLRLLINRESYRAITRVAAWRMVSDEKMPEALGYSREQYGEMLRHPNSVPFTIITNLMEQGDFKREEMPKFFTKLAEADHHELAAPARPAHRARAPGLTLLHGKKDQSPPHA